MDKEWVEKRNKENEQKYEELKNNLYKEIKTSIYLNESKRQAALQHCEDEDFFRVEADSCTLFTSQAVKDYGE